jgi:hypothetical protein
MTPLTPTDVRLGNLTSHGVVISIVNNSIGVESNSGEWYSSYECDIHPVPLTPEILEGFGFKVSLFNLLTLYAGRHAITFKQELICVDDFIIAEHIQHAHTLQNFVQAISGVELVFNQKGVEK